MTFNPDSFIKRSAEPSKLWRISIILCTVSLLVATFRWLLIDFLTIFLEPLLEAALWLALLVLAVVSAVRCVTRRRLIPHSEYKSLSLIIATGLILYVVPFTSLTMRANFNIYRKSREHLVPCLLEKSCGSVVRSGGRGDLVALPQGSGHLSSGGGEVMIDHRDGRDYILFFTFRGILDRFSGYVYSPSDAVPARDQFLGDGAEIEKVAQHWYWYAS